ncbi:MAG: 50S ribosomal protein L6 [Patescibacteria group bacterium]|jgi:large subunit ribosomal protein L6
MSRIGKKLIVVPAGVTVTYADNLVTVKGPKGELTQKIDSTVKVAIQDGQINLTVLDPTDNQQNAFWGLFRKLIANMVEGVVSGFSKKLEINGVGYKVASKGDKLVLNLGFSHPIEFALPQGITAAVEGNQITISGLDRQLVGQTAANIRKLRKPEPYKGKGIKYSDEVIHRKAGKAAKAGA